MALNDVYSVNVKGTFVGQEWNCVYYYDERLVYINTTPTRAQVVAEAFEEQVLPEMLNLCVADVLFDRLIVKNLFNEADAYTLVVGETGTGGTGNSYMGTFSAYSFELQGESAVTRLGAKRIPGVIEEVVNDGMVTDGAFIGNMNSFAAAAQAPLTVGAIIPDPVYVPVIVKRVRSGTPGNYLYRLPTTISEKVVNTIVSVLVDLLITTQNTRKIGVGS